MNPTALSRRSLIGMVIGSALYGVTRPAAAELFSDTSGLGPGRFVWQPRLQPEGPVLVLLSPLDQSIHVYRGSHRIGISTCRIANGASLPLGVFQLIDQSGRTAGETGGRSNWQAAATFAEGLATAGTALPVRLPRDFARLLLDATRFGATIAIAPRRSVPVEVSGSLGADEAALAAMLRRAARGPETAAAMGEEAQVVVSAASGTATLVIGGVTHGAAPVEIADPRRPLGTHVFSALGPASDGRSLSWLAVGLAQKADAEHLLERNSAALLSRIRLMPGPARDAVLAGIGPRTALVLTDAAAGPGTRLAARGIEIFSDGAQPSASPKVASQPPKKGRFTRRGLARTAEGNEPAVMRPETLYQPY